MIAFVLPTYGQFDYAQSAALSFFATTPDPLLLLIDDASPDFADINWTEWTAALPKDRVVIHRFEKGDGLTRSWNYGLHLAREFGAQYALAGNSDILFTANWAEFATGPLEVADDIKLIGPVSNAPGRTNNNRRQFLDSHLKGWELTDDPDQLDAIARRLQQDKTATSHERVNGINGFCMLAETETWWAGAFDRENVFDPSRKLVGNEDELQKRWRSIGWHAAVATGSFVFHYRAVTRGSKYTSGAGATYRKQK